MKQSRNVINPSDFAVVHQQMLGVWETRTRRAGSRLLALPVVDDDGVRRWRWRERGKSDVVVVFVEF